MNEEERIYNEEPQHTQEFWMMVLFSFLNDSPRIEWDEFEHDLKYVNRFSSSHAVVDAIIDNAEKSKLIIPKGHKLFRARVYKEDPIIDFLPKFIVLARKKAKGIMSLLY